MLSFLSTSVPKTDTASQNPIRTEDGKTEVHFLGNDPTTKYGLRVRVPPGTSIHEPPYHWHKYQSETFLVHSGVMRATLEGTEKTIPAGQTITIAPGLHHTFANGSTDENLIISTGLDPAERERDEAFFRNIYMYLEDCRKAKRCPNVAQIMLFLYFFDCYPGLPGPKVVSRPLSQVLVFILGVMIGKWLLGFKESYPEYYQRKAE